MKKEVEEIKLVLKHAARMDVDEIAPMVREQIEAENKVHAIPAEDSPASGPASAKVVIVEFTDFECPYCAMRSQEVKKLQDQYPKQVRVIFKHFPLDFHKKAPAAHAAAMAAQKQGKFWEYRYALTPYYSNLNEENLLKAAQDIGLDLARFKKEMVLDDKAQAVIARDIALGGKIGVRGTPTFYVNGKLTKDFSFETVSKLLK